MPTNQQTAMKDRVLAFKQALEELYSLEFEAGAYFSYRIGDIGLSVLPLDGDAGHRPHLISLSRGLNPPPEVREVPCGVTSATALHWVGMTDSHGQFIVALPPGTYRVRYVVDVARRLDAEIVLRIGDESLFPLVEDSVDAPGVDDALKQDIKALLALEIVGKQPALRSGDEARTFDRLVKFIRTTSEDSTTGNLVEILRRYGGEQQTLDFTPGFAGATGETQQDPIDLPTDSCIGKDRNHVFLLCDIDVIPNGVCWLGIVEADGSETMYLPILTAVGREWTWRERIQDILGGKQPKSPTRVFVIPATDETYDLFDSDEVRNFIRRLPADSLQRLRAETFFQKGSESNV